MSLRSEYSVKISKVKRHIKKDRSQGFRFLSSFPKKLAERIDGPHEKIWGRFTLLPKENLDEGLVLNLELVNYNHYDVYKLLQQTINLLERTIKEPSYRPLAVEEFKRLAVHPAVVADKQLRDLYAILTTIADPPPRLVATENLEYIRKQLNEIAMSQLSNYVTEEIGLTGDMLMAVLKYLVDNRRIEEKDLLEKFDLKRGVALPPEKPEEKKEAAAADRMEEKFRLAIDDIFLD